MTRREVVVTVAAAAAAWLMFSEVVVFIPLRLLVTLVHEAGHAVTAMLVGGDVLSLTVNPQGGGLTVSRSADAGTLDRLLVASAGYVGAAVVGAVMLELSRRLRNGRVALIVLAFLVAAIGLAWVPWSFDPDARFAQATGSGSGDGRFTILVCVVAVVVLGLLAVQPVVRLRRAAVLVLATCLCLAAVDDLRFVLELSRRGGHSDAASAAAVSPLSSWMWAAIWMLFGIVVCGVAAWSAASGGAREKDEAYGAQP